MQAFAADLKTVYDVHVTIVSGCRGQGVSAPLPFKF
jgi:hypothetical protein